MPGPRTFLSPHRFCESNDFFFGGGGSRRSLARQQRRNSNRTAPTIRVYDPPPRDPPPPISALDWVEFDKFKKRQSPSTPHPAFRHGWTKLSFFSSASFADFLKQKKPQIQSSNFFFANPSPPLSLPVTPYGFIATLFLSSPKEALFSPSFSLQAW